MNLFHALSAGNRRRGILPAAFSLLTCAVFCGCQMMPKVYPEVKKKTVTELYYEAVAASQNAPDRNGTISAVAPPEFLPAVGPATPAPVRMQSPAATRFTPSGEIDFAPIPLIPVPSQDGDNHQTNGGWQPRGRHGQIRPVSNLAAEPAASVTEFFEDTDVRQALQSLASQAEQIIIIDEQVSGVVTAVIENETFEAALKKVLLPLGLVSRRTPEGEYLVGVPDPSSPMFARLSERLEYRPMHLSPEELSNLIPERDKNFIQIIDARNRILIEAPAELAQALVERLQQFDTPIPQVELEAIVCVVSPDRGFKSGLDWNHALTLNGSEVFNFGLAGLAFSGQGSGAGMNNAFSNFSVTSAFVKLLAQEGYLAIRAAPRVTARDGDQARISITRESFFSTQPQSDNTAFFRQEIKQVQAGIELDITPIVRGDNITVKIEKAEVSEDIRSSQINSGITENPFPQINRRNVSTTVHVKDGETVVIGGLVQRQTVDRIAKVPVLGDLPFIGRIFQTVEQKEQDAEVVIFISPRLVQPHRVGPMPSNVVAP